MIRPKPAPDPLTIPWYPVVNDLIGGWACATVDKPCSEHNYDEGEGDVADFVDERTARHIAGLHNASLAARGLVATDDPTSPHILGAFRDWEDFVVRVARPLVETEHVSGEADIMALYRSASPYFICAAMVMMANRIEHADQVRP